MSDIAKRDNASMMMLAQAIGGLNVMEPPEIPTDQSWLPRKFTKSKVKDIMEMSDMMASTLEHNTRALKAKLDGAHALMTASDNLKDAFEEFEHKSKMRNFDVLRGQAIIVQEQGKARKITLECELLEIEVKDAQWTFDRKIKGDE
jgi:hypothetical protein